MTDLTGYIVCLYRVFKGDDGEKFERNWLYWTGKGEGSSVNDVTILTFTVFAKSLKKTWGQFHRHVYAQLLRAQIRKVHKAASMTVFFCAFGICARKICSINVVEIDPRKQSYKINFCLKKDKLILNPLMFHYFNLG